MSEAKFTKGPWQNEFKNIGHVTAENGAVIAKCQRLTSLCNMQDNAHLIAAAPELYEALENVLHEIKSCLSDEEHYFGSTERFDAARAALAKARGEA